MSDPAERDSRGGSAEHGTADDRVRESDRLDATGEARPDAETAQADREDARTSRDDTQAGDDARTAPEDPDRDPDRETEGHDGSGLTGGVAVAVAAGVAFGATAIAYLWADNWFGGQELFFENLFRIAPTVSGGGVGTDWVVGNTVPVLDAAIAITHAADAIMGVFILVMVFIHWAAFRQLSDRMRRPADRRTSDTVATDGGERNGGEER
ncbi:hypothetical protein [Halorussus sp. MSC15.2]|uniref:hypothetical protein n=1 Tax=Halorussus sp. MSC15.2 TaxID=2283638 RepID=UPI0013D0A60C|nr:hypothetical protein [Halorussus sp. MSC15.2]NEU56981.1 hypothetical protein [Halorussus sp. MSC15.2]